jgi:CII-binding regulator of phage lambda lysogenization HflD
MGETMFDDKFFDDWLDGQAQKVMEKVASGEGIAPEQMMILMLKAQTNHFAHLDVDLRSDMQNLDARLSSEMLKMNERLSSEMRELREDMDKRFEQVDKRFEQVDKRFEQLTSRIDHFMIWSFATTISVGGIIIAAIKFL